QSRQILAAHWALISRPGRRMEGLQRNHKLELWDRGLVLSVARVGTWEPDPSFCSCYSQGLVGISGQHGFECKGTLGTALLVEARPGGPCFEWRPDLTVICT
ncbi:hypothetical protein H1C71_017083, partial [Ictidomys tridecemlineatus]